MKKAILFALIFFVSFGFLISSHYQTEKKLELKAEQPILITSCGQSPGPVMVKVFLKKLDLEYDLNPLATAEDLIAKKEAGTPYGSVIIVMGASLKGMGAAGISIDDEIDRIKNLIQEAKSHGITVIGAHIEGMKRRAQGAAVGDNTDELSIDAVAPNSDFMIINKDGNTDNRFTIIATEKNISMIEIEKNMELLQTFEKIYQK